MAGAGRDLTLPCLQAVSEWARGHIQMPVMPDFIERLALAPRLRPFGLQGVLA
jgi:hypothetical protein